MAAKFTRDSIVARLRAEVGAGRPVYDALCGSGLTAKMAARGGADLVTTHCLAYFRMQGLSSMAGYLPICDANALTLELGERALIGVVREEYEEVVKREVREAIASDREALDRLCAKYLDNVRAYTARAKLQEAGRQADPDERLMRAIEEKVDISEGRKDDFRHELMNFISALEREGRTFDWTRNRRLARALELKVFEDRRDSIQLTSLVSTVVDPDTQAKIGLIRERLMRLFGYDELSADEVLQHVAGLFARGEAKQSGLEAA